MKSAFFMMFAMAVGVGASSQASAQGLDKLKGMMGGGSSSSLSSATTGNAAGVIQFCLKNNYLGSDGGASTVKDKLMGKLGGTASTTKDPGYLSGASGILQTGNGKKVDLSAAGGGGGATSGLKDQLTKKVCDQVLKQGKSMVGM